MHLCRVSWFSIYLSFYHSFTSFYRSLNICYLIYFVRLSFHELFVVILILFLRKEMKKMYGLLLSCWLLFLHIPSFLCQVNFRVRGDIRLYVKLFSKVLQSHYLIRWLNKFILISLFHTNIVQSIFLIYRRDNWETIWEIQ